MRDKESWAKPPGLLTLETYCMMHSPLIIFIPTQEPRERHPRTPRKRTEGQQRTSSTTPPVPSTTTGDSTAAGRTGPVSNVAVRSVGSLQQKYAVLSLQVPSHFFTYTAGRGPPRRANCVGISLFRLATVGAGRVKG